ncbi:hypothetical protein FB545_2544 [Peribacillus frigoritolerans]|nr:hypothetical protein FB545_2544 [Peribacillus frigoritolerans]
MAELYEAVLLRAAAEAVAGPLHEMIAHISEMCISFITVMVVLLIE